MNFVAQSLVVGIGCMALAGCADKAVRLTAAHHDNFARYPALDTPERWCLNNSVTVLKPQFTDTWLSVGKVLLEPIMVDTECDKEDVFKKNWEFKFHETAAKHGFTIKYNSDIKHQDLRVDLDPNGLPVWVHHGDDYDHYIMLAEATNSEGKRVKYYRVETFRADETYAPCNKERPDYVDEATSYRALVKLSDDATCGSENPDPGKEETSVSGGGEGK